MTESTHGWTVGGEATLTGSYHSPNFLSYNISPYLNQSRANSNFQSISDASGVNVSTNIFAGSHSRGRSTIPTPTTPKATTRFPGLPIL